MALPATARAERPYQGPASPPTGEEMVPPRVVDPTAAATPDSEALVAPEEAAPPEPKEGAAAGSDLAPEMDPEDGAVPAYDPTRDSPEALRARSYIQGGIIVLTTAVALGIGSVVMGTSDPCAKRGGNNCHEDSRNRAALSMGIPGIALMAAGAALLGVGLRQRARLRASLAVGRGGAAVALRLRF